MRKIFSLYILLISAFPLANSQGIYTEFGQNRIQHQQFHWKTLASENIEVLFYNSEDALAANALQSALKELSRVENYLSYKYGGTMQIMVFSNLNDYRQSNIGYSNPQMNSGGYLVIPNDINTVYFNGDYNYLKKQITQAVCEILLREMIYGGSLQDRFERVRTAALPLWFTSGLSQFLSESWNADVETHFRDAMLNHQFSNFNLLTAEESTLAGIGIWRYLVEKYGAESISTIVFIARYTHSAESAIYFHTKKGMPEFLNEWRKYFEDEFKTDLTQQLPKGKSNIPKKIANKRHTDIALSPDGSKVAIVTNEKGRFDIWEYNLNKSSVKHLYHGGLKVLNQLPDYQFPKIKWNANGDLYALIYESGIYKIKSLTSSNKREINIDLTSFTGINDFSFVPDKNQILFSCVKNGKGDIYLYHFSDKRFQNITDDYYFDHNAIIGMDGSILFISNRPLLVDSFSNYQRGIQNLFEYKNGIVTPLTNFSTIVNLSNPICYSDKIIGFLSDLNGLNNAYLVHVDSGFNIYPQTNYQRGILSQDISNNAKSTAEMLLINGKNVIFTGEVPENPILESVVVKPLLWKKHIQNLDSIFKIRNQRAYSEPGLEDSAKHSIIDSALHNYTFQTGFPVVDYANLEQFDSLHHPSNYASKSFINVLQPEFLLSQVDNRVLGSYAYSNRIKHEAIKNPWLTPFVKISLSDMLKNYVMEAGARVSLDLYNTDYLTRFSLLKYRLDHDFSISRHSRKYEDRANKLMQNLSVLANYTVSYPFSENARLAFGLGGRQELLSAKGSEKAVLNIPDKNDYFITSKIEFIYDNTTAIGLNSMNGFRFKTGLDFAHRLNNQPITVNNFFIDARLYVPIKRGIHWANKLTALYALGKGKVANYLGSVENAITKAGVTQFSPNPVWLNGNEYVFQQWVCNLRGFNRGIRMGSSFALLNSELRIPVVAMLRKKPLESEFMRNFTIIGFCDAGTAFIGKSPADPQNPFNTLYYSTPNYSLSVTSQRNPFVVGVGFGVRTRIAGYFLKYDRAKGYEEKQWNKALNYLSLGFDF